MNLPDIFGPDNHLVWWQECNRTIVVFIYGLLIVRLAGRRVFGKWAALDIIVSITVGSNLSRTLTGNAAMGSTLVATTLLMALHWLLAQAAARSDWMAHILEGLPQELARDGKLDRRAVLRRSITRNDIEEALRGSEREHVADTRLIMLEPSGKISVLKAEHPP